MRTFRPQQPPVVLALSAALGLFVFAVPTAQAAERTTSYTYNAFGKIASSDGPRTDVADITTYDYDSQGNRIRITNALGQVTQITAYDDSGRPLTTIDPNGLVTNMTYDLKGHLTRLDRGGEVTEMGYDAVGNLISIVRPDGTTMQMQYDAANRLVGVVDAEGNQLHYTLDKAGNRTRVEVKDASNQLVKLQRSVFDELSRTLKSIGAADQTTSYSYDVNNNRTGMTDANGNATSYAYDPLNRLVSTTDPLGGNVAYGYDPQDNLTAVTDPNGNTTSYTYDGLGNLISQTSPDTGTTTYTHDAAGNVLTRTDANGQTTTYQYDALNRLIHTVYTDGSEVSYEYDSAENGIGRLARVIDSSGETAWQYDQHGRTTKRIQTIQLHRMATRLVTAYQYNDAGQMSGITYPSGLQVNYNYTNGKVSGITANGKPLLKNVTYQAFGAVTGWQWGNGSQSQRGYDLDGRLIRQSLGTASRQLTYDADGNITAITEPDESQAFGYDALSRLNTAASSNYNLSWAYDANGNRLSQTATDTTTSYSIESGSNKLIAVDASTYQYDANGNLIDDGAHTYQYDAKNRLVSVDNGDTAQYRYNAMGQRVFKLGLDEECDRGNHYGWFKESKHDNGRDGHKDITCVGRHVQMAAHEEREEKKAFGHKEKSEQHPPHRLGYSERLFDYDQYRLLGEYNRMGRAAQETVWLGSLPVAAIQHGRTFYIHTDHLGTPRVITNRDNNEVWHWDSDPFGVTLAQQDEGKHGKHKEHEKHERVALEYNLRFPGQYYDAETNRHYNYFRDYDPATGRYIESDPIGLDGGFNTYEYANSNVIKNIDPFGLLCVWSQSTGHYRCTNQDGKTYAEGTGYAGKGAGKNNPYKQDKKYVGPIPRGLYVVGGDIGTKGPCTLPLEPVSGYNDADIVGRDLFRFHGDSSKHPGEASEGCPVMGKKDRCNIPAGEYLYVTW